MLVVVQVTLGAFVVVSQRQPWVNSVHVVVGAMVLTTSLVIALRAWQVRFPPEAENEARRLAHAGVGPADRFRKTCGRPKKRAAA